MSRHCRHISVTVQPNRRPLASRSMVDARANIKLDIACQMSRCIGRGRPIADGPKTQSARRFHAAPPRFAADDTTRSSPTRGPTTVTSGIGCSAHTGGSTPAIAAARRANSRSKPAGAQTIRKRAASALRLASVCGTPPSAKATSPARATRTSSPIWKVSSPSSTQNVSSKAYVCSGGPRSSRRNRALDQRDPPVGLFAAQKNPGRRVGRVRGDAHAPVLRSSVSATRSGCSRAAKWPVSASEFDCASPSRATLASRSDGCDQS
jgi:hypothetical protein